MTEEEIKKAAQLIGKETKIGKEKNRGKKSTPKGKKATLLKQLKSCYNNWRAGILFSIIPLLTVPIWDLFMNGDNLLSFFYKIIVNCEIIYIGVVMCITATNDGVLNNRKKTDYPEFNRNMFLILFGSFVYALISIGNYTNAGTGETAIIVFNICFFALMYILNSQTYRKQIKELENNA